MEEISFLKRKGGIVLLWEGRQYYKHTVYKSGNFVWKCSQAKKIKCRGSITIKGKQIVKSNNHSCKINYSKNKIDEAIDKMKEQTRLTDTAVTQIFNRGIDELENQGINFISPLPAFKSVQTSLYSCRHQTNFRNVATVTIPPKFSDFVLAEYYDKDCVIIVFCSEENRIIIKNIKEFFIDGTFQSCPAPFTQLLSIHGDISDSPSKTQVIPLIYALMTNKNEESYTALFLIIKVQIRDWSPIKIHLDFEVATANALMSIFPIINLKKCYYHLTKSIWKKAKKIKIKSKHERRIVGLFTALPLLPLAQLTDGVEYKKNESPDTVKIKLFIKYMERTWLKNEAFISQWNVYGERHRTNNVVESWHSQLNKDVKKRLPKSLLRLLNILVDREKEFFKSKERRLEFLKRDDAIMNCQMQLIHRDISVGHFLEKLR